MYLETGHCRFLPYPFRFIIYYSQYISVLRTAISQSVQLLGCGLDRQGMRVRFLARARIFLFSITFRPALGPTQPPAQWIPVSGFPEVQRPGRETDHSSRASAEVKNDGAVPPLPTCFRGVVLN
jgi:hypothetical protein